jgi:hypothetical protein
MTKSEWWFLFGALFGVGGFVLAAIAIPTSLPIPGIIMMFIVFCCIDKGYQSIRKEVKQPER